MPPELAKVEDKSHPDLRWRGNQAVLAGSLLSLGALILEFYVTCLLFVFVVLGAVARACGGSLVELVPMVMVTMPCEARNGPQVRMDDCGDAKPGQTETQPNGGLASPIG